MSAKISEILEKASRDRGKGDYARALKRLREGIEKHPSEAAFYQEAMEIALDSGETLSAIDFFKQSLQKVPGQFGHLWDFAAEKVRALNDPILCKFLVDVAIRKRDLKSAERILQGLKDHTAAELLKRTQTKIQSLSSAMNDGMAFKRELVAGALAEGLLCFRSKRFQHGTKAFLRILDEKPVEHEVLTPFLAHLEKKYPRQGGVSYVLGCCHLANEKFVEAFPKLCHGAALLPSLAEDAINRLEAVKQRRSVPQEELNLSLARLFMIKGDDFCAAERFGFVLQKNPAKAYVIVDLLKAHVQETRDNLVLDPVFMEAALLAKKPEIALSHIKKTARDRRLRNDLLAWLDAKSQEQFLPAEILSFYAELTLEQGRFEKAVEIFRAVLTQSPGDGRVVASILERHPDEPAIRKFLGEISHMMPEAAPTGGGFNIEHFERREFTLDGHDTGVSSPRSGTAPLDPSAFVDPPMEKPAPGPPAEAPEPDTTTPTPEAPADETSPGSAERPTNVIVDEGTMAPQPPETTTPPPEETPVAVPPAREHEVILQSEPEEDFDALCKRFDEGRLSAGETPRLVERAMVLGRWDAAKKLLTFTPENVGQEIKRKLCLAAYYLEQDQPLSALVILKSIHMQALSREERRTYLLRIAQCYQTLNRFGAAHSVYLRIMSEDPDFAAIEEVAKLNYQKYLREIVGDAPILEKVTSI